MRSDQLLQIYHFSQSLISCITAGRLLWWRLELDLTVYVHMRGLFTVRVKVQTVVPERLNPNPCRNSKTNRSRIYLVCHVTKTVFSHNSSGKHPMLWGDSESASKNTDVV